MSSSSTTPLKNLTYSSRDGNPKEEEDGARGRGSSSSLTGLPRSAETLLELILGEDEALLNIMAFVVVEHDGLHDGRLGFPMNLRRRKNQLHLMQRLKSLWGTP